jgi:hypothetical protein
MMPPSRRPRISPGKVALLTAAGLTVLFGFGGFIFALAGNPNMGLTLFAILPFATGLAVTGAVAPVKAGVGGLIVGLVAALFGLITLGIEGIFCGVMAVPFILPCLLLGALMGWAIRRFCSPQRTKALGLLLGSLVLVAASSAERAICQGPRLESVETTIRLLARPDEVWPHLLTLDEIRGPLPFLLRFGLPVPVRCTLEREAVGAHRVCHFRKGTIDERVTEIHAPFFLRMEIVRNNTSRNPWLSFKEAIYELRPDGDGTVLTRTTTYTAALGPRWYWRLIEGAAFQTEHGFVLDEVARRAERR